MKPATINKQSAPLYLQVKNHILEQLLNHTLKPGMRIASETELVESFGVSRMTVNRALRELTNEGKLYRIQGKGTYVAEKKVQSALLRINPIRDEILARGGKYSCQVHLLQEEKAPPSIASIMNLNPYSPIYHSIIIHKDNGIPIQVACRYINPEVAPDFLNQDFSKLPVSQYLLSKAPVTAVEHIVEALIPDAWIRKLLQINSSEPCLSLQRKTWASDLIATHSIFYYPGSRYSLGGTFTPEFGNSLDIS